MILSDEAINDLLQTDKSSFGIITDLSISHIKANARIRELEAQCEDSRLVKEGLRNNIDEANSHIHELEDTLWYWLAMLSRKEDRADRLAVVADALAEELTITHDATIVSEGISIAVNLGGDLKDGESAASWVKRIIKERNRAEAKLRELAEAAEWRDECDEARRYCFWRREDYSRTNKHWHRWGESLWHAIQLLDEAEAAYQAAALKAKEG